MHIKHKYRVFSCRPVLDVSFSTYDEARRGVGLEYTYVYMACNCGKTKMKYRPGTWKVEDFK